MCDKSTYWPGCLSVPSFLLGSGVDKMGSMGSNEPIHFERSVISSRSESSRKAFFQSVIPNFPFFSSFHFLNLDIM